MRNEPPDPTGMTATAIASLAHIISTAQAAIYEIRTHPAAPWTRRAMRGLAVDLDTAKAACEAFAGPEPEPAMPIPTAEEYRVARKVKAAQRKRDKERAE